MASYLFSWTWGNARRREPGLGFKRHGIYFLCAGKESLGVGEGSLRALAFKKRNMHVHKDGHGIYGRSVHVVLPLLVYSWNSKGWVTCIYRQYRLPEAYSKGGLVEENEKGGGSRVMKVRPERHNSIFM